MTFRFSLAQFVFKSACFLGKQTLQFQNSFIFNLKHQTNDVNFFEQGRGKFPFGKKIFKRESPTLRAIIKRCTYRSINTLAVLEILQENVCCEVSLWAKSSTLLKKKPCVDCSLGDF